MQKRFHIQKKLIINYTCFIKHKCLYQHSLLIVRKYNYSILLNILKNKINILIINEIQK